ncbi:hypothetical protein HYQ46_008053 [Verticillium longisporum]|nr:hypothetical protein HYQ46_008053 [Verticillium longisporum]
MYAPVILGVGMDKGSRRRGRGVSSTRSSSESSSLDGSIDGARTEPRSDWLSVGANRFISPSIRSVGSLSDRATLVLFPLLESMERFRRIPRKLTEGFALSESWASDEGAFFESALFRREREALRLCASSASLSNARDFLTSRLG